MLFCLLLNFNVKERIRIKLLQCYTPLCLYHKPWKEISVLGDYRICILRYPGHTVHVHSSLIHKTLPIISHI